jgi:hypothetical protein
MARQRASGIWAESAPALAWDEEHVDPAFVSIAPCLQVADRPPGRLDDERLDVRPR